MGRWPGGRWAGFQALSSAVQYQNLDLPGLLDPPEVGEVGRERHSPRVGGTFGGGSEQEGGLTGGFFGGQLIRVREELGAASGAGLSCRGPAGGPLTSAPCSACPLGPAAQH